MKLRLTSFLLVVLLILAIVPAAGAQDNCLGLSEADCAIYTDASTMGMMFTSANMTYDFSLNVGGLAMLVPGSDSINITSSGSGVFSYDPAGTDTSALTLQMDTSSSFSDGTSTEGGDFNFRIVDGFFYLQDPATGEWLGVELESAVDSGAVPFDPSMLGDMAAGGFDPSVFTETLTGLGITDVNVEDVVSLTRGPDEDRMGQTVYVFTLSMDFGQIFQSPNFQQTVTALMSMAGSDDPSMAQMGAMVGPLLQGANLVINVTEYIGADDGYIHGINITLTGDLDMSALFGAAGAGAGGNAGAPQMPPITFDMSLNIGFENINGAVTVTAPEGAEIIDPEDFEGLSGLGF